MAISLQTRLLLTVGAVALAAVATVAVSARLGTRVEFNRFQNLERTREGGHATPAMATIAAALDRRCCAQDVVNAAASALDSGEAMLVFDRSGALLASTGRDVDLSNVSATFRDETLSVARNEKSGAASTGMTLVVRGVPNARIALADGAPATVLALVWPKDDAKTPAAEFLGSVDRRLLAVTLAVGALALIVTWVVARRIGRPIAELNRATGDLARGDFSRRVTSGGSDELGDLARAFNSMAAELERQQTLRRNLVHDVAHELRTPLTSLRCRLETIIDGLATDPRPAVIQANDEVAHLSQLVADLEELAHAEAGELALSIADVNLSDVARSSLGVAGLDKDARVRLECDEATMARGDAMRIRQIVVNLLTNADRHTPDGGAITVRVATRGDRAVIEVHNTGSALTADEAGRVFDRFYRADPARQRATGGSGLGLAIVKHLSEVQNGSACASSDATGVLFSVGLPSAESSRPEPV